MLTQGLHTQLVVSNIFYFHPYLGMISNLTHIFQMGWFNHQLATIIHQALKRDPYGSAFGSKKLHDRCHPECFWQVNGWHPAKGSLKVPCAAILLLPLGRVGDCVHARTRLSWKAVYTQTVHIGNPQLAWGNRCWICICVDVVPTQSHRFQVCSHWCHIIDLLVSSG